MRSSLLISADGAGGGARPADLLRRQVGDVVGLGDGGLPAGQKEFYEECGWQYVLNDRPLHLFCAPEQTDAPDLHTDPAALADSLKTLRGSILSQALGTALWALLMFAQLTYLGRYTLELVLADAAAPLRALHPDASDASWALRWVAGHPNVHVVLSGMSAEEQLADNLTTFDHFVPLSPAEDAAVEQAAAVLHSRIKIGCTGCRYCMPCPMGVDIPDNFSIWNRLGMFQQPEAVKKQWTECFPDSEKALHCVRCGKCETVCPQKLPIRASLARLQEELDAL